MTVILSVENLHKTFETANGPLRALQNLSFEAEEGEFLSIVGPSGCGKSTLLRCLCGLTMPTEGEVRVLGKTVNGPQADLAVVFQEYTRSLFPWKTVSGNVELPLKAKKMPRAEATKLTEESLAAVGLSDFAHSYPWQLSGGMQQRVAIARALAFRPKVLIMDEPFASLDAQMRSDLEDLVLTVREQFGITVLFVTHDIDESVYLGNRIVVLGKSPSRIVEIVDVNLPQQRDQVTTKSLPEFARLRGHVLTLIQGKTSNSTTNGTGVANVH